MQKKYVLKEIPDFNNEMFIGGAHKVLKKFSKAIKELENKGWKEIQFKFDSYYDYCDIIALGKRLETDLEFEKRRKDVDKENINKKKAEERRRAKYEELKKEFGDGK